MAGNPPAVAFVGRKNSGKTSVLVQVVRELKRRGLRVGTLKHAHHHDFEFDRPGRDSYRHFQAGADVSVVSSSVKLAMVRRVQSEPLAREIVRDMFPDVDIVLVEGYKTQDLPKIEVYRRVAHRQPLPPDPWRIAVVSDDALDLGVPLYGFQDLSLLADMLVEKYSLDSRSA